MVLENETATIVTTITTAAGSIDNYTYLALILGGIIGTFLGMIIPYYRKKREFGKEGIDLLFDKDFLKVAGFALATSVIGIGALYPTLLAGADPSATYFSTFLAAATTAFTVNVGGSWMIGTNNKEAEEQLAVKKAEELKATGRFNQVLAKLNKGNVVSPDSSTVDGAGSEGGSGTDILGGQDGVKNPNA